MNTHVYKTIGAIFMMLGLYSCSEDLDAPVLPEVKSITIPQGVTLSKDQLFGVWGATTAYGDEADNHFEQQYEIAFQSVEDGEAVLSHWYTDAASETRDSVVGMEYTYTFDGATIELTPKTSYAAKGAAPIKAIHIGGNRLLLLTQNKSKTDTICTMTRKGDPIPSITSVDRTLPQPGETVTITGRNLQFVDHIFLPTRTGEVEVTDVTVGSKEIKLVIPNADFQAGSIRCQSTGAGISCYSPAYMFCYDGIYMHNFNRFGKSAPYTGTEFEYSIKSMGTIISKAVNLSSTNLPSGHHLENAAVVNPDSLLSIFGNVPIAWPVSGKTDNTGFGYIRFSSGDRFQYVLDHCNGLLTSRTPCTEVAIQMDIYVTTGGQPVWNTGYVQYRLNKDQILLIRSF